MMNKRLSILAKSFAILALISILPLFAMAREPADQPAISLVLGESEGRIAVMTADGQIYALLDRYTETLPHSERNRLRRGIPISNGQELGELLEGYES